MNYGHVHTQPLDICIELCCVVYGIEDLSSAFKVMLASEDVKDRQNLLFSFIFRTPACLAGKNPCPRSTWVAAGHAHLVAGALVGFSQVGQPRLCFASLSENHSFPSTSSPSAFYRALGKKPLCQVLHRNLPIKKTFDRDPFCRAQKKTLRNKQGICRVIEKKHSAKKNSKHILKQ